MNSIADTRFADAPPASLPEFRINEAGEPVPNIAGPEKLDQWLADLTKAVGMKSPNTAITLLQQAVNASASALGKDGREVVINAVIELMADIRPRGAVELMLAVQMIAAHFQSVRLIQQASRMGMSQIGERQIVLANRLLKTFVSHGEALRKCRKADGQAIVGNVENHPGGRGN